MAEKKYIDNMGLTQLDLSKESKIPDRRSSLEQYKDLVYQCGKCGTCRTVYADKNWARVCPSGEFGGFEAFYLGGKNLLTWGVTSGKLDWTENLSKILFECTLCLACQNQCQIPIIHNFAGEWLMAMREEAVRQGVGPMSAHKEYTENILKGNNPYGEEHGNRLNWMSDKIKISPDSKLLYFTGCTSSYREKEIALSTAEILNEINVEFNVLKDENCCGSPVNMTGQNDKAQKIAESNVKMFKGKGIEKIITSCAGCYRMLKEEYPKKFNLDHGIEVVHFTEFLEDKIQKGEINFTKEVKMKITYHDPCHMGRHMGIYEPPRSVLSKIPGIELIEMERNRENAWCCGSGAGVRSAFKEFSSFSADERIQEAKETSAEAIVSCCPFCLNQFNSNIKDDEIKAFDITELVKKAL